MGKTGGIVIRVNLVVDYSLATKRGLVMGTPARAMSKEEAFVELEGLVDSGICLLYTSPSPRDRQKSRMPSSA